MPILVVEDDRFYALRLAELLEDHGKSSIRATSVEEALSIQPDQYESAIIDVMLPNDPASSELSVEETRGGYLAGLALARRLRKNQPQLKLALITGEVWETQTEQWAASQNVPLLRKVDGVRGIVEGLQNAGFLGERRAPKAFIVHGHDETALLELKNYLQNVLKWQEPLVLREQANCGKTIIEKFEEFATRIDCVFVLLTPDDQVVSESDTERRRSRQNVIFELGFFFGQFGRQSGRVIVLYKGPNELPSDIQGLVWLAIDGGVEAAGEAIRREVERFTHR